jgi:hypothetical protein
MILVLKSLAFGRGQGGQMTHAVRIKVMGSIIFGGHKCYDPAETGF